MLLKSGKFKIGWVCITRGVRELVSMDRLFAKFVLDSLRRHASGNWGHVDPDDYDANERALIEGTRLLSVYEITGKPKIWIITEADRSATTVLFPDEY